MADSTRRCAAITQSGERCKGVPVHGSDRCPAHHPDTQSSRRAGAIRGGRSRPHPEIATIKRRLMATVEKLEKKELDPKTATAMNQCLSTVLRALQVDDELTVRAEIEERLGRLEEQTGRRLA